MANEFSTGKSIFVLAIVAGCFAILWPNVFYPMLQGSYSQKETLSSAQEHMRQERPPHLRPEFLHPALREKGRAIPHSHVVPKVNVQEGKAPLPGMRPPMGGPGQVVPPPKGSGTMGIIMPMYTIGIIVFFLYTMMKLLFKKSDTEAFESFSPDPHFRKNVLKESGYSGVQDITEDGSKLGDTELDFLRKRLQETEKAMERIVAKMMSLPNYSHLPEENDDKEKCPEDISIVEEGNTSDEKINYSEKLISDEKITSKEKTNFDNLNEVSESTPFEENTSDNEGADGKSVVKVLGMEMTESCEHGAKWSRPPTPLSRPPTPQNIFISGSLPSKSQLLVSDSHTESVPDEDNAVVLTGKVTLSLIGLSENGNSITEKENDNLSHDDSLENSEENQNIISSSLNDTNIDNEKEEKNIIDSDDEEFITVNNKENDQ